MAVTKKQVFSAADQLQSEGKRVTLAAVREITRGSYTTVGPFFNEWKSKRAPPASSSAMPPEVMERCARLWAFAVEHAEAQLSLERKALAQIRREMDEDMAEVTRIADARNNELKAARRDLKEARHEAAVAREEVIRSTRKLEELIDRHRRQVSFLLRRVPELANLPREGNVES